MTTRRRGSILVRHSDYKRPFGGWRSPVSWPTELWRRQKHESITRFRATIQLLQRPISAEEYDVSDCGLTKFSSWKPFESSEHD